MSSSLYRIGAVLPDGQVALDDIITAHMDGSELILSGELDALYVTAAAAGLVHYIGPPHNLYALKMRLCDCPGRPTFWWVIESLFEPEVGCYLPVSIINVLPHVTRMASADFAMNQLMMALEDHQLLPSVDGEEEPEDILKQRWDFMETHLEESPSAPYVKETIPSRDEENVYVIHFLDKSGFVVTPTGPILAGTYMKIPSRNHPAARNGFREVETYMGVMGHA